MKEKNIKVSSEKRKGKGPQTSQKYWLQRDIERVRGGEGQRRGQPQTGEERKKKRTGVESGGGGRGDGSETLQNKKTL